MHQFGGPLALGVRGMAGEAPALHRVLTLSLADPLLGLSMEGLTELPLVYGFLFDGCRLKYRLITDSDIEPVDMNPRSPAADWPYPNYPAVFSAKPFALLDDSEIEPDQVHELTWQGVEGLNPAEGLVVIVPPSEAYGVSLWGDGENELVQVIFEIDATARTVAAYNQAG